MRYFMYIFLFFLIGCKNPLVNTEKLSDCFESCSSPFSPQMVLESSNNFKIATRNYSFTENIVFQNIGEKTISNCSYIIVNDNISSGSYSLNIDSNSCQINFSSSGIGILVFKIKAILSDSSFIEKEMSITINEEPPIISSAPTLLDFKKDTSISAVNITATNNITGCSVSPTLPLGLSLSYALNTCSIIGTPTQITPIQSYVFTLFKDSASSTVAVNIGVYDDACQMSSFNSLATPGFSTDNNAYIICTANQLSNISSFGYYQIGTNINLSAISPFSYIINDFNGELDGRGHEISNYQGTLVNNLWGTIKNLKINNVSYNSNGNGGFLAYRIKNTGYVNNIDIENASINDLGFSSLDNAGIAGLADSGSIISNILIRNITSYNNFSCIQGLTQSALVTDAYVHDAMTICDMTYSIPINSLDLFPWLNDYWINAGSSTVMLDKKIIKIYQ